jgi:hypothetical protein
VSPGLSVGIRRSTCDRANSPTVGRREACQQDGGCYDRLDVTRDEHRGVQRNAAYLVASACRSTVVVRSARLSVPGGSFLSPRMCPMINIEHPLLRDVGVDLGCGQIPVTE